MLSAAIEAGDADTRHRAWYTLGEIAERAGDLSGALEAYRACVDADPSGRYARRCLTRTRVLDHGGYVDVDADDIALLQDIRNERFDRDLAASRQAVAEMAARHTDGAFAIDLRLWLASDAAFVAERPADAWAWYVEALEVPDASPQRYRTALDGLVSIAGAAGRVGDSRRVVAAFRARHPELAGDDDIARLHDRLVDEQLERIASIVAAVSLPSLVLAWIACGGWVGLRRDALVRWRPWRTWMWFAWIFVGAAAIGGLYTEGAFRPMLAGLPGIIAVYTLSGSLQRGERPPRSAPARVAVGMVVAAATFSAIYVALALFQREAFLGL